MSRVFTALITKYPSLWDPNDLNFTDKTVKDSCRVALLAEINSVSSIQLTAADVKRKIRSYQSYVRRQRSQAPNKPTSTSSSKKKKPDNSGKVLKSYKDSSDTSSSSILSHIIIKNEPEMVQDYSDSGVEVLEIKVDSPLSISDHDDDFAVKNNVNRNPANPDSDTFTVKCLTLETSQDISVLEQLDQKSRSTGKRPRDDDDDDYDVKICNIKTEKIDPGIDPASTESLQIRFATPRPKPIDNNIELPTYDPEKSDREVVSWCRSVEIVGDIFKWSSIQLAANAGTALKGSALHWYEAWEPKTGRTWENFKKDIVDFLPENKDLAKRLATAILYDSGANSSYCEYAREKLRLLKRTKVSFTDSQLIELVCAGVCDANVRQAFFNSSIKSTSELINIFSIYSNVMNNLVVSTPKKHIQLDDDNMPSTSEHSNTGCTPNRHTQLDDDNMPSSSENCKTDTQKYRQNT